MTWIYTPYAGILHSAAIISAIVGLMVLRRHNNASVGTLALLMFAVTEWAFTSGLESAVVGLDYKIFWSKLEYLGALSAPTLFMVFALKYCQKNQFLKPVHIILLSIVPITGFIVTATNEWTGLIWSGYTPSLTLNNVLIYGHGLGYYFLISYQYLIILIGIIALLEEWIHANIPYRRQVGILLLGSLFPFVGGIIYTLFPKFLPGLNLTPVTFSITGLVITFGIFKHGLFDLTPIARDVLIENMDQGILVIDLQNRVVDINPVAQTILNSTAKENLGQPISTVLKFWPRISKSLQENGKGETEVRWGSNPPRYFHLSISPLFGQRNQLAGRLIVLRDDSKRHQTEAKLAHTIKEMGIINHISLAITSGLDMQQVLRTLHLQCSLLMPIDIFYVALYDEHSSLIHVPLFFEDGEYQVGPSRDINDHPGTIGTIIRSGETLFLNNIINSTILSDTRPHQLSGSMPEKTTRSYIGIPLRLRDRVIGVLSIQNYRPEAYTEDHLRVLDRIAIQAAIAIENARLYSEIQRLAIIDELTGIYNYRGLQELGSREVERALRFKRPLSVLFFDIDDFRNFNNTYNHSTGNIILQTVSECCRSVLRSVDVLARYGGDEFVALLPETDITSAEGVARRLVENISRKKIATQFGDLGVTISIGITGLSEERSRLSALIDRANIAEHQAKKGQKGVVVVAP